MHFLLELFDWLLPHITPEGVYHYCKDNPVVCVSLAFAALLLVAAILFSSVSEFIHIIFRVKERPHGKIVITALGLFGVALAVFSDFILVRTLQPAPAFEATQQTSFIREPVVLGWTYNGEKPGGRVVYEIEVSEDRYFQPPPGVRFTTEGNSWYSFQEEGEKWWRVRAVVGDERTRWSDPIKTSYYKDAFARIKQRRKVSIYLSNRITQGIFKFLDAGGRMTGVDPELGERIAARLRTVTGEEIEPIATPIAFDELLSQPGKGTADVAIASITKRDWRANKYHVKFSEPYFCTTQSLLFRKRDDGPAKSDMRSLLKGKTVGFSKGSTGQDLVDKLADELRKDGKEFFKRREFNQIEDMIQALLAPNSHLQFGVTDTVFAAERVLRDGGQNLSYRPFVEKDYPASIAPEERRDEYAVAVDEGEIELLKVVDEVILDLKKYKIIDKILEDAATKKFPDVDPAKLTGLYRSSCAEPASR